jgi:hypothetical protein
MGFVIAGVGSPAIRLLYFRRETEIGEEHGNQKRRHVGDLQA